MGFAIYSFQSWYVAGLIVCFFMSIPQGGIPVTFPLPFTFDQVEHRFTLPRPGHPPAISAEAAGQTSLTLLRYDPQVGNERYLLFFGQLEERDTGWSFTPSRVVL